MKIILINNLYPPYQKGGAEKIVELTAQGFREEGHEVTIITSKPPSGEKIEAEQDIYHLSSLYYHLDKIPKPLRLFWHVWDLVNWKNYIALKKILKKENPDLVITHNLKGIGGLTAKALRKKRIKHIHTLHDIQLLHPSGLIIKGQEKILSSGLTKLYIRIGRLLWRSPDLVISPSHWLLDLHKERRFFPDSLKKTIRNPLPNKKTKSSIKKEGDFFNFLYVGQLEKHKGIDFLISAFEKDPLPKSRLIVIGRGSEEEDLKESASRDRVFFLGSKDKEGVEELMRKADCLIVPSLCYENSPTVIYEAIQAGLPVLASDLGGIPELSQKGMVELFIPEDKKDLIIKMKEIKNNYDYYRKRAERKKQELKTPDKREYCRKLIFLI